MLILLLAFVFASAHPFHVSVMEIKYKEDQKSLQISTRIFLDDLEIALRTLTGDAYLDIMDEAKWEETNAKIGSYLLDNIAIESDKNVLKLKYLGSEIEKEVMWSYIEIERVRKIDYVKIRNKILIETYADQENLVHFYAFDDVQSARLFKGNEVGFFDW